MPLPNFSGSTPSPPPPGGFRRILFTNGGSLCQAFLAEAVKTERGRSHAFLCEESLGKIKVRAFPKRVGPRILSLESAEYFATSEHY